MVAAALWIWNVFSGFFLDPVAVIAVVRTGCRIAMTTEAVFFALGIRGIVCMALHACSCNGIGLVHGLERACFGIGVQHLDRFFGYISR